MTSFVRRAALPVLLALLLLTCCFAQAEPQSFASVSAALKYIRSEQPTELTLEGGNYKPSELLTLKNAMPEGAAFHFHVSWGGAPFSDETTDLDLRECKGAVTVQELEAVISLCPGITRIDNSKKRYPTNKEMIALIEKYPDIQFEWIVSFGHGHYCATTAETFSTKLSPNSGKELTTEKMELLKYCHSLKALDLGHNKIKNLEFLKYVPDLELLIIGDNQVSDLTPVSQLKHLQFAEMFKNPFTDLTPLASCTELLDLNLTNCPITDLSPLDDLHLERLWANMCKKLPLEEQERYKQAHPDTIVDFRPSGGATIDGWRSENPHYKHYIWCFKNNRWIPFSEPLPTK